MQPNYPPGTSVGRRLPTQGASKATTSHAADDACVQTEGLHERLEEFQWTDGAPWTETLIVTSQEPTVVPNVHDDLNRELAFYNQAMAAAKAGMLQLIEERCPFRCAPLPAPPGMFRLRS